MDVNVLVKFHYSNIPPGIQRNIDKKLSTIRIGGSRLGYKRLIALGQSFYIDPFNNLD